MLVHLARVVLRTVRLEERGPACFAHHGHNQKTETLARWLRGRCNDYMPRETGMRPRSVHHQACLAERTAEAEHALTYFCPFATNTGALT